MDYTLIHYDVEAWEGKAYAYGLQVRACCIAPGGTGARARSLPEHGLVLA